MSALSARLDKLALRIPEPQAPSEMLLPRVDISKVIAGIKARTTWFKTATPLQKIGRLQDEIREMRQPMAIPEREVVFGPVVKLGLDRRARALADAELELLASLGYPRLTHPLSPAHREILDIELFAL